MNAADKITTWVTMLVDLHQPYIEVMHTFFFFHTVLLPAGSAYSIIPNPQNALTHSPLHLLCPALQARAWQAINPCKAPQLLLLESPRKP